MENWGKTTTITMTKEPLVKKLHTKAEVEFEEGKMLAVASEGIEDREGEILDVEGWDLKNYKKNPIILWAHSPTLLPIGTAKNIGVREIDGKKKLTFEPVFHEFTELAKDVKKLFEEGILKTFSVGFLPIEFEGNRYLKQELLEISAVNVPSLASAEVIERCKGLGLDETRIKAVLEPKIKDLEELIVSRPMPNEHSCRLRNPADFQPDSFRSMNREYEGKKYRAILGKLIGEDTMTEQAYHYSKDSWTVSEAQSHCKSYNGSFEPATEEELMKEEKKKEKIIKTVIGYGVHGDGPKAPEDTKWDAGAEIKKASGDAKRLRKMHAWVDSSADNFDPSERQWYKLPHHKGDGDQAVVWNGVRAAMAALFGARGGVQIPSNDRRGVFNHLSKHYTQFDKEPPEFKAYSQNELQTVFPEEFKEEKEYEEPKEKEGRILSSKNRNLISECIAQMKKSVSALEELLEATEPPAGGEGGESPTDERSSDKIAKRNRRLIQAVDKMLEHLLQQYKENK